MLNIKLLNVSPSLPSKLIFKAGKVHFGIKPSEKNLTRFEFNLPVAMMTPTTMTILIMIFTKISNIVKASYSCPLGDAESLD